MATLVFTALGTLIGGPLGGAIGAIAGRQLDTMLIGGRTREGPRLNELRVTTSSYGVGIPRQFGTMRVAGQILWATDLKERSQRHGGGKGRPAVTEYTYSASFAVALSSRPLSEVRRIWADGKLLRGAAGDLKAGGQFRLHPGTGPVSTDPLLAAAEAAGHCPAYSGLAYAVFEDLELADFGNRIPALTFEVVADTDALDLAELLRTVIDEADATVPLDGIAGITGDGPVSDLLATLDPVIPVSCDVGPDRLTFRGDRIPALIPVLPPPATAPAREDFGGPAGFAVRRAPEPDVPVQVLRYYDAGRDYQPGAQRAGGRQTPGEPRAIELPAALHAADARRLIEQAARRAQWSRQTVAWRVSELDPQIGPGATVRLPGRAGLWRVTEWEWREHGVELALSRLPPAVGMPTGSDPGRAANADDLAVPPTVLAAIELPWDGNPATPVPLIIAAASATGPAWPGAALFADSGDGVLIALGPAGRDRAVIGEAETVLAAANPLLIDRQHRVIVRLAAPDLELQPATQRQLALGANRALLGDELVQFATADPLGAGRWELGGLWRARAGTEAALATHRMGEPFVLLDGRGSAVDPAPLAPDAAVVAALGRGDAAPARSPVYLRGIGQRPLSPVHPRLSVSDDGAARLAWTRRARGAWAWTDQAETPLNEQREAYEVIFTPPAGTALRWDCPAPVLMLTAGEWAQITAAPTGSFAIRQRGDFASSDPLLLPPRPYP